MEMNPPGLGDHHEYVQPMQQQGWGNDTNALKKQLDNMDRKIEQRLKVVRISLSVMAVMLLACVATILTLFVMQNGEIKESCARRLAEINESQHRLEAYINSARAENDAKELSKFLRAISEAAQIFPSSVPGFVRFIYNRDNGFVANGENSVYNSQLRVWREGGEAISVDYNQTYICDDDSFSVSSLASDPFILTMGIRNREKLNQKFFIEETRKVRNSGDGSFTQFSDSFTEGLVDAQFRCQQINNSSNLSIIQIFLVMSSTQLFQSSGQSALRRESYVPGSNYSTFTAKVRGSISNHYFSYILMSRYPRDNLYISYMRNVLRQFVRNFQSSYVI